MELAQIDKKMELSDIITHCAKFLDDKKANNTILLDVTKLTPITEYFLIASVQSFIELNVLSDYIDEEMMKFGIKRINPKNPFHESPWVVSDYGFAVLHLFLEEARGYFNIEKFWHDGEVVFSV